MTIWKVCKVCGEYKDHHAHSMCKRCYVKECNKVRRLPNSQCPTYLGCNIAEKVLSKVFKDVKIMKRGNPSYDFICNKGKKIDVKSSCIRKNRRDWSFNIKRNIIADFFLCIAFDDCESLTPLYLWLIPSSKVRCKRNLGISQKSMPKWDKFKLDISNTLQCCDKMRS